MKRLSTLLNADKKLVLTSKSINIKSKLDVLIIFVISCVLPARVFSCSPEEMTTAI